MLTFDYTPGLTKEKVLSLVTEQDIIEAFLGDKIKFKQPILSPFREERSPSFTFKKVANKIIFRDWGNGKHGDAFNFVQSLYACSFNEALYIINEKLNLNLTDTRVEIPLTFKQIVENDDNKEYSEIFILPQIFTITDYKYWNLYGISLSTLNKYNVKSCKYVWLNNKLISTYSNSNPTYAYIFKCNNNILYKIYKPFAEKKSKWMCNITPNCVEGFDMLDWVGDIVILTKSMKDVMCLRELGYNAFSLHGETNMYPRELHDSMLKRFKHVVVFYDNDKTGIERSKMISDEYQIDMILIPDKYNVKDISDFILKYSVAEAKQLINNLLNK